MCKGGSILQIKMNGQPVNVKEGATIMEAASGDKYARTQYEVGTLRLADFHQ